MYHSALFSQVSASSEDGGLIMYSLSTDEDKPTFKILEDGTVRLISLFNYETVQTYLLTIEAQVTIMLLVTCHLSLVTCYLLLGTYHMSLVIFICNLYLLSHS